MAKNQFDSLLVNKRFPAYDVLGMDENTPLKLLEVSVNRKWDSSKNVYSDDIESITYTCAEPKRCTRFNVKIEGQSKPLMDNEELQILIDESEAPLVVLDNLTILAYIDRKDSPWSLKDSFKATNISFDEGSGYSKSVLDEEDVELY